MTVAEINALTVIIEGIVKTKYSELNARKDWKNRFTRPIMTNRKTVTLAWIYDTVRLIEEPIGKPPSYRTAVAEDFIISLKQWGAGIGQSIYDISADDLGLLRQQAEDLALAPFTWIYDRIRLILTGGIAGFQTFDGQNLFSDTHNYNGFPFDNLLGPLSIDATGIATVQTAMAQFPSGGGEALGLDTTDIFVPYNLRPTALEFFNNQWSPTISKQTENVFQGNMNVEAVAQFTDPNDWFVMHAGPAASDKPFAHVKHSEWGDYRIVPETALDSDAVKIHHEYRWYARSLMQLWPIDPRYFIQVVN